MKNPSCLVAGITLLVAITSGAAEPSSPVGGVRPIPNGFVPIPKDKLVEATIQWRCYAKFRSDVIAYRAAMTGSSVPNAAPLLSNRPADFKLKHTKQLEGNLDTLYTKTLNGEFLGGWNDPMKRGGMVKKDAAHTGEKTETAVLRQSWIAGGFVRHVAADLLALTNESPEAVDRSIALINDVLPKIAPKVQQETRCMLVYLENMSRRTTDEQAIAKYESLFWEGIENPYDSPATCGIGVSLLFAYKDRGNTTAIKALVEKLGKTRARDAGYFEFNKNDNRRQNATPHDCEYMTWLRENSYRL